VLLVAKKPEEPKPAVDAKAMKGTLHKPAAGAVVAKPAKPAAAGGDCNAPVPAR
jgi:translation initiation factor IF-2